MHRKYFPCEIDHLVQLWICLVKISATLGTVLSSCYTAKSPGPTQQQMDAMEHEIAAHLSEIPSEGHGSELKMIYLHQIRLCHECAMPAFCADLSHQVAPNLDCYRAAIIVLYLSQSQGLHRGGSREIEHQAEHRAIHEDEAGLAGIGENPAVPPELLHSDMLPMMSPDGEFSLHEQLLWL
ncbi:uncharacterized protein MAM_05388 [Metarhizium album ARSEF 1941]|uniref:Uncharacterized protein n=1 Tax=Metarhizium album (strain ARSEF 1941) TaxID=1081103 RepID=A0A0B2WTP3_METAS|nr:uncharacterized protein MAM_05388 [Metarhizium album ARSEF 1941]KHN96832.1 hypothetical protein MAM_05388 [Metarhizium album ARSEF 1941]